MIFACFITFCPTGDFNVIMPLYRSLDNSPTQKFWVKKLLNNIIHIVQLQGDILYNVHVMQCRKQTSAGSLCIFSKMSLIKDVSSLIWNLILNSINLTKNAVYMDWYQSTIKVPDDRRNSQNLKKKKKILDLVSEGQLLFSKSSPKSRKNAESYQFHQIRSPNAKDFCHMWNLSVQRIWWEVHSDWKRTRPKGGS